MATQGALSATERSMRSVFVNNIACDISEEQLKDIFSEVGPVISFRLICDRETGKSKGYGFCEYIDQDMSLSAVRNLNGYELNGKALTVDNAASEKSMEELKNLQASLEGPSIEDPHGSEVEPDKAPEAISKAVASLPPEQMFELMKQMKMCIQNNPNEARNLLLQNPQLAYALLQAQVVMRIVDPVVAMSILHRQNPNSAAAMPTSETETVQSSTSSANKISNTPSISMPLSYNQPAVPLHNEIPSNSTFSSVNSSVTSQPVSNLVMSTGTRSSVIPLNRSLQPAVPAEVPRSAVPSANQYPDRGPENFEPFGDPRSILPDLDMRQQPRIDLDMRQLPKMLGDQDMRQPIADQDLRMMPPNQGIMDGRPFDPRFRQGQPGDPSGRPGMAYDRQRPFDPRTVYDNRSSAVSGPTRLEDPRSAHGGIGAASRMPAGARVVVPAAAAALPVVPQQSPVAGSSPHPSSTLVAAASAIAPHDQEKAALIMQVLQLSEHQISMLPQEQRQSIMILKDQIARSGPR